MKLVVHELVTNVEQSIIRDEITYVRAIRPNLLVFNKPTGTLALELRDSDNVLIATSDSVDIQDICTLPYFHGYVTFNIRACLNKNQEYKIRLISDDGYAFDESAYIGWCNGYDTATYPNVTQPADSAHHPLDYQIWERKRI